MSGGVVSGQFTEALADYLAEWFSNGAELPREELVRDAQGILDALLATGVVREEAAVRAEAWDEGVATTLDRAVRNEDGITLRLDVSNPYRALAPQDPA